ncbi:MAG: hypothetical protein KC455_03575 [Carnobacterium sp.]|nr:hypothetical protein [Carnobacterium sp.]
MKLKWNRLSFILVFLFGVIILGIAIFGQITYLNPIKARANLTTQQVERQTNLEAAYPPKADLLEDYRLKYEKTWSFLPESERVSQELVALEQLAAKQNIKIQQVVRVGEPQSIEGFDESFKKSSYEVDLTSTSVKNIQALIEELETIDRVWNIYSFGFEKLNETSYAGKFTFELFYYVVNFEKVE